MPLGVSEGLIKEAYGAVDLSGLYKTLDGVSKKIAAEDKAHKEAAAKDYYKNLADLNKESKGVRAIDMPEINQHFSDWKSSAMALSSDPNLFHKDPVKYGELMSKQDEAKAKLVTLATQSRELDKKDLEISQRLNNPTTKHNYSDSAYQDWIGNVRNKKAGDVYQNGYHNESNYFRKDIDLAPISKTISDNIHKIESGAKDIEVARDTKNAGTGAEKAVKDKWKGSPHYGDYVEAINNSINTNAHSYSEKLKIAEQMLSEYQNTDGTPNDKLWKINNDLLNVDKDRWSKAGNPDVKNILPTVKDANNKETTDKNGNPMLFFGDNPIERVAKIKAAESALRNLPTQFVDDKKTVIGENKLERQKNLFAWEYGFKKNAEKIESIQPLWGDPDKVDQIVKTYNTSTGAAGQMTHVKVNKEGSYISSANPETDQIYRDMGVSKKDNLSKLASTFNQQNMANGLPTYKVTEEDIANNRVLAIPTSTGKKDENGRYTTKYLFLSTGNPNHAQYIDHVLGAKSASKSAQQARVNENITGKKQSAGSASYSSKGGVVKKSNKASDYGL